jgi:hypothetical protein
VSAVRAVPAMPVVPAVIYPAASTAIARPGVTKAAAVDHTRRPAPPIPALVDPPRSSREALEEAPPEAKRIAAPPRLRPAAPIARPRTPPIEDLYDTR